MLTILKLSPASGENTGLKRKAFSAPFDSSSGLGLAMASIINLSESILHNLIENNDSAAQKIFPDEVFETPSIANFSSGWQENTDYLAWAKFDMLDPTLVAIPLEISTPKLNRDFLN